MFGLISQPETSSIASHQLCFYMCIIFFLVVLFPLSPAFHASLVLTCSFPDFLLLQAPPDYVRVSATRESVVFPITLTWIFFSVAPAEAGVFGGCHLWARFFGFEHGLSVGQDMILFFDLPLAFYMDPELSARLPFPFRFLDFPPFPCVAHARAKA